MSILKLSLSQILIGLLAGGTVFTFLALPTKANTINEYNRAIASLEIIATPSNEEGGRDNEGTR